jgi:hypothetical protein
MPSVDRELRLDALRLLREAQFGQLWPVWTIEVLSDATSADGRIGSVLKRAADTEGDIPRFAEVKVHRARKQVTDALHLARKMEEKFSRQADTPKPRGRFS